MSFLNDLETGKKAEKKVIKLLETYGMVCNNDNDKNSYWDFKGYILDKEYTFEVKHDVMASKTGNVAIEYFNPKNNSPSGINITKADFWVFVFNGSIFIASVSKLKKYISVNKPYRDIQVAGNNNASLYLYKKDKFLSDIFIKMDNIEKMVLIGLFSAYASFREKSLVCR